MFAPYITDLFESDHRIEEEKLLELESKLSAWANNFDGPGVYLEFFAYRNFEYNVKIGEGLNISERDFGILESLGLIKRTDLYISHDNMVPYYACYGQYCCLTGLGVDFVSACDRDTISKFKAREAERTK